MPDPKAANVVNTEQWNRNVDLLNLVTYGHLMFTEGRYRRNVSMMLHGCQTILEVVGPQFYDEDIVQRDGNKMKAKLKGVNTNRFRIYFYNLSVANNHVMASLNPNYDRFTRYKAAQAAYDLLLTQGIQLLQEVDALGMNIKVKNPGHIAGIMGN